MPSTEKYTPENLVSGVINLVTLPEICRKINLILADPDHKRGDIDHLIRQDPALTMRILRIVNSSYYGLVRKIDRVDHAVSIIGEDDLSNLVLATSATAVLKRLRNPLINFQEFWRHSVECGLIARAIAKRINDHGSEMLFTAGLLHDIGKVVLYHQVPDLARAVLHEAEMCGCCMDEAERRLLTFDHAQVGGALARAWKLPEVLCQSVAFHHQPSLAQEFTVESWMVHIANVFSTRSGQVPKTLSESETKALGLDSEGLAVTGLNIDSIAEIVAEARNQCREVQSMICPCG